MRTDGNTLTQLGASGLRTTPWLPHVCDQAATTTNLATEDELDKTAILWEIILKPINTCVKPMVDLNWCCQNI